MVTELRALFRRSYTELRLAMMAGQKWTEYLPLVKRANTDDRLLGLMRREWGDPIC